MYILDAEGAGGGDQPENYGVTVNLMLNAKHVKPMLEKGHDLELIEGIVLLGQTAVVAHPHFYYLAQVQAEVEYGENTFQAKLNFSQKKMFGIAGTVMRHVGLRVAVPVSGLLHVPGEQLEVAQDLQQKFFDHAPD